MSEDLVDKINIEDKVTTQNKKKYNGKIVAFIIFAILAIIVVATFFVYTQIITPKKRIENVNSMITVLSAKETLTQIEVNELTELYNSLTEKEKNNIDKAAYDKSIELRPIEKAAVSVAHEIKDVMRSSDSFKLLEDVKVKKAKNLFSYYVLIKYSGQNGFGGTNDQTSCLGVSKSYSPVSLELSYLTGRTESVLNSTETYVLYIQSKEQEYIIDDERVMANIDLEVQE